MKQICFIVFFNLIAQFCFGQSVPQGMKFQAVARDLSGEIMANQPINLQISLVSFQLDEKRVHFTENQTVKTNQLGMFDLVIGGGKKVFGDFNMIPWSSEEVWTEFKLDFKGTGAYKTINTSRLLAVPYAFHAGSASQISDGELTGPLPEACATGSATGTLWSTGSNCATSATAKLGTSDYKPLRLVTNNVERIKIDQVGNVIFHEDVFMEKDLNVAQTGTFGSIVVEGVAGEPEERKTYPAYINAQNVGLSVKLKNNSDGDNVFLGFFDDEGMKGSISGQTASELYASPEFILANTSFTIQLIALAADGAGLVIAAAEAYILLATIPMAIGLTMSSLAIAAQLVDLGIQWVAFGVLQGESVDGVVLNSGAADYAEWLERANPTDNFVFGQIVGVKGGKISFETKNADHVLAISKAPIVLGNMPPAGNEKGFEKVAFLGQVPVRVLGGAKIGDFILASGHSDGFAIAVSPEKMKIEDYSRIVGVAWEATKNNFSDQINVAVGINTNDMADKMAIQNREIMQMQAQIKELYAFAKGDIKTLGSSELMVPTAPSESVASTITAPKTPVYSDEILENYRPQFEAKVKEMVAQLRRDGLDYDRLPAECKAMLENPVQAMKDVQTGKYGATFVDQLRKRQQEARSGK
jgi:hypothetical protein